MDERPEPLVEGPSEAASIAFASPSQVELLEALRKLHPRLAQCFDGALRTFMDQQNPDCLAQSAHSVRELFDALPLAIGPPPKKTADLKTKVRELADAWAATETKTAALEGQSWGGQVDGHLAKFLTRMAQFIQWFEGEHPKHAAHRDMALDHFDPARRQLPPQLSQQRGKAVSEIQRYMNSVAHHNIEPSRIEICSRWGLDDHADHRSWAIDQSWRRDDIIANNHRPRTHTPLVVRLPYASGASRRSAAGCAA
jgi:hypothetical protein